MDLKNEMLKILGENTEEKVTMESVDSETKAFMAMILKDKDVAALKEKAQKNDTFIVDYLDYVMAAFDKQIVELMKKTKIDYDQLAEILMK